MRGRPERRLASAHRLVLVNLSAVLILRWAASPVGPDLGFVIVEPGDRQVLCLQQRWSVLRVGSRFVSARVCRAAACGSGPGAVP